MKYTTPFRAALAIATAASVGGIAFLIAGCGNTSQKTPARTPKDDLIQTFVSVQKCFAVGDYEAFKTFLGPDFRQMENASSDKFRNEFFAPYVFRHGSNIAQALAGDNLFLVHDYFWEYDLPPGVFEWVYHLSSSGETTLVFPDAATMAPILECRALFNSIRIEGTASPDPKQIGQLIKSFLSAKEEIFIKDVPRRRMQFESEDPEDLLRLVNDYCNSLKDTLDIPQEMTEKMVFQVTIDPKGFADMSGERAYQKGDWTKVGVVRCSMESLDRTTDTSSGTRIGETLNFRLSDAGKWELVYGD